MNDLVIVLAEGKNRVRGSPPTGLHFGPEKDYIPGSLFKEARYKIEFCVVYYIVIE